jgi:phenylacetate-CoA ligase
MSRLQPSAEQRRFLDALVEHEAAPCFNSASSDMLTDRTLALVRAFQSQLAHQPFGRPGQHPSWLGEFVDQAYRKVPYYRELGRPPRTFEAIPPFGRDVLQQRPWALVPDDLSLEALTVYTTSGTSGTSLLVPTHSMSSSKHLVLLESLLQTRGVSLPRGPGAVAIVMVAYQQETMTYASMSHLLEGAAFLKLNLAPHAWRDPEHRGRYLLEAAPAVVTGSPYAFARLAEIAPALRPRALISSAVALHPGHAAFLERQFECPVFDLYSMTECRGIAGGQKAELPLLSPDLYVEILGPQDEPLPEGQVGEIVLTGARNPYLPLLRYRTGDRAALHFPNGRPVLVKLEGRQSVHLETRGGTVVPTLDVVHALRHLPLVGFALVQSSDRSVAFEFAGPVAAKDVEEPLQSLFGAQVPVRKKDEWVGKPQRFSSALGDPTE